VTLAVEQELPLGLETLQGRVTPEPVGELDTYVSSELVDCVPGSAVVGFLDDGHWSACFGLSYRDMLLRDALAERRIVREGGRELRQVTGAGGIASSRNKVAAAFLDHTDGEWLAFIDTDMGFAPDSIDRLIASADKTGAGVIGALCFAGLRRKPAEGNPLYAERFLVQPTLYDWVELDDEAGFRPRVGYERDAVQRVDATGAAFLLIRRTVLASMRETAGDAWFEPVSIPGAAPGGGRRTFSEDMSFCLRLGFAGVPCYVDTAVKTTHEKGFLYLDEPTFDEQQKRG
jgi:hypothetical protein